MAMFNGNGGLSIHGDVLNASPEGEESRRGLVEELKRRAKSSMSNRNFPEAIALYTKAIEVCPTEDKNPLAILYANRSLANLSMSANTAALNDANQSIDVDSTYLKGHFRKVMALISLKDYLAAKELIVKCLELQPEDPDLLKQLQIVNQKLSEGGSSSSTSAATTVPAAKTTVNLASSGASTPVTAGSSSSSATSSKATAAAAVTSGEDDDATASNENLRGYKLTKDGKKTTFFNNELDETTKALIGSIAPKKLDPATSSVSTATTVAGQSVWNSAGTFESVDHSVWARDRIKTLICGIPEIAAVGDGFSAVAIKGSSVKVSGDAETVMLRGKRKQICDFTIEFDWSATADGKEGNSNTILEGQLTVNDVTADKDYEFSCVYPKFSSPKQKDTATKSIDALQCAVKKVLDSFFEEFGTK